MSINLVGPDGAPWVLDNDDPAALDEALRQGFKMPVAPREKSELEQLGEGVAAGTLGAVEGLSGGLFGTAVGLAAKPDRTGFVDPGARARAKEVRRLDEENPVATGAGELAGMLFSPIGQLSGGIRTGIGATTKAGKLAASGLGGAVEGSLFGAGATLSDAMLGDAELTADKLIAGAGLGALLGAGGGSAFAGIEEGVRAVLPKLGKAVSGAQGTLDELANDLAIKATRAQQSVINRVGETKLAEAAKVLRDRGHLNASSSSDDILKSLTKDREEVGKQLGKFIDDADAAAKTPTYSQLLTRLDDFQKGLNPLERQAVAADLKAAREAVLELGARPVNATGKGGSAFRAFDDLKQTIQAKAKFSQGPVPLDDVQFGLRRQLAGIFRDELDQQLLPQLGSDAAKKFTDSKAVYGALKDAERLATSGVGRAKPGGFGLGLYDLLAGVMGGSFHPAGIAAAVASKFMRERAPAIISKVADSVSRSPALKAVAESMGTQIAGVSPRLGPYGPALAQAFARSPEEGLAMHLTMAQVDPNYSATAQAVGLTHESPEEKSATLGRAQGLASLAGTVRSGEQQIGKYLDQVMKGSGSEAQSRKVLGRQDFGEKRMRRDAEAAHTQRVKEVRELATNPEALLERIAKNLEAVGPVAPGVASALAARANVAVQYLAKAAEVPPKPGPLAPDWVPTEAERNEFTQKLEVVEDPMSVMRHAAAGTLTDMQVEALKTVYPSLWQSMSEAALAKVAEGPKEVPYSARLMLSVLTGIDVDGSLSFEAIVSNQNAIRATKQKEPENAAPQSPGARSEMTLAGRMATPEQRREMETASEQA